MEDTARLESFKAYDVRGKVPEQLNEEMAELIGRAYAELIHASRVVVGHDIRLTSPQITAALCRGLVAAGVDVVDIGLVGTEEVYHATFSLGEDGGIMVTASHNPREYNGMKFTRAKARPISSDTGLFDIEERVRVALKGGAQPAVAAKPGSVERKDVRPAFIQHLLTYFDRDALRPLKVVVNPGNGGAGPVIDLLEPHLPLQFVKMNYEPDGTFPLGVPNPLLPENRAMTSQAVLEAGADLGIAWDGDFDRCFFFDEKGEFVDGYYLVGLLAQQALKRHPGANIIHDPRLVWNTIEVVEAGRRYSGGVQERPRVHQGEDARGGCGLRRGDVGSPLLPRVLLLRLGHDPVAPGGRGHQRGRAALLGDAGGTDRAVPHQR